MELEIYLKNTLTGNTQLYNYINNRVFPAVVSETAETPYLVYGITENYESNKDASTVDTINYTINIVTKYPDYQTNLNIKKLVIDILTKIKNFTDDDFFIHKININSRQLDYANDKFVNIIEFDIFSV